MERRCWINSHSHEESWDLATANLTWIEHSDVPEKEYKLGLCSQYTVYGVCAHMYVVSGTCLVLLLARLAHPHLEHLLLQFWVPIFKWQTGAHPEESDRHNESAQNYVRPGGVEGTRAVQPGGKNQVGDLRVIFKSHDMKGEGLALYIFRA